MILSLTRTQVLELGKPEEEKIVFLEGSPAANAKSVDESQKRGYMWITARLEVHR